MEQQINAALANLMNEVADTPLTALQRERIMKCVMSVNQAVHQALQAAPKPTPTAPIQAE
jgi:hypothetical protein